MSLTSEITPLPVLADLETTWRALEARCQGSFFTTWNFIGPLLCLTAHPPQLFVAREADAVIGLALIARKSRDTLFGKVEGVSLNQTDSPDEDLVYIEFNDVLCPEALRHDVLEALANNLRALAPPWAELHLAGVSGPDLPDIAASFGLAEAERKTSPAPFVDLAKVRGKGYLALLGRNTRSQVGRARRLFEEKLGPLALQEVHDEAEIRSAIMLLGDWQTAKFAATGTSSSLQSKFFMNFLTALLLEKPVAGTKAELLRVDAGGTRLGLLLNFCHRGTVANYQCAFAPFPEDNKLKPGHVSHALAVEHYSANGHQIYHFLGGDQQYKKSLSTDTDQVIWTRLQKPGARLSLESLMKTAKARLRLKVRGSQ